MKADLHMHTSLSDGAYTAEEIIKRAKKNGTDIISITDHDVCKNVEENFKFAEEEGIIYLPGIELSTIYKRKPVHVLGYFRDDSYKSEEMLDYYTSIREGREKRAVKFIENLKKYNDIEITYEEVYSYSRGIVTRPHIAKAIINNYPQYEINEIFRDIIGDYSKAYVPSCEISIEEGINLLRRNNCLVVLAHPTLLKDDIKDFVISQDYDGFEGIYFRNKEGDEQFYRDLAKKRDMIITAGGDYHGTPGDSIHADIGEIVIEGEDLQIFLDKLWT